MSKKCDNCRYFATTGCSSVCTFYCSGTSEEECCQNHEAWTLFDRIISSPEVLAPKFVYYVTSFLDGLDKPKKIWYSTLITNQYFKTELEAKRATVAKLKEVTE